MPFPQKNGGFEGNPPPKKPKSVLLNCKNIQKHVFIRKYAHP